MWEAVIVTGAAYGAFQIGKLLQWLKDARDVMNGDRRRK
jgi:hypothetical protein